MAASLFNAVESFFLGLALYGSVYLLPQYLTIVQGYSAFQIGLSMIWVGIPQLVIFPFVPQLMKRFDLRLLVCFGTLVFATSSWMSTSMCHDYAGQQFAFANIVRAIGQPFTIIPLSSLATTLLDPRYDCATRRRGTGLVMSKDHDQKGVGAD